MREPSLRVITPLGWRVEKVRRRRMRVGEGRPSGQTQVWLEKFEGMLRVLREGGEVGVFYPWGSGSFPPREMAREFLEDKRWLWLPTYGGFIRLGDGPIERGSKPLMDFRPGEFFLTLERVRMPGFSSFDHVGWGRRVCVRIPDGLVTLSDKFAKARLGVAS